MCYNGIVQKCGQDSKGRAGGYKIPCARLFSCTLVEKEEAIMPNQVKQRGKGKKLYWSLVGAVSAVLISIQPVMAETIWDRFSTIMKDFYGQLIAISTIVAVTMAAIALIVRMVSRNQRTVDEATAWLKRIVITWIVLNSLGFIVAYLQPLISGGNYKG